MEGMGK